MTKFSHSHEERSKVKLYKTKRGWFSAITHFFQCFSFQTNRGKDETDALIADRTTNNVGVYKNGGVIVATLLGASAIVTSPTAVHAATSTANQQSQIVGSGSQSTSASDSTSGITTSAVSSTSLASTTIASSNSTSESTIASTSLNAASTSNNQSTSISSVANSNSVTNTGSQTSGSETVSLVRDKTRLFANFIQLNQPSGDNQTNAGANDFEYSASLVGSQLISLSMAESFFKSRSLNTSLSGGDTTTRSQLISESNSLSIVSSTVISKSKPQ